MKRLLLSLFLAVTTTSTGIMLSCSVPIIALSSCSTTQKTAAYRTLASIQSAVDGGMKAFADAVVAGKVPADIQAKVKDAHDKYRKSMEAAILAARFDLEVATPENLQQTANDLLDLIVAAIK